MIEIKDDFPRTENVKKEKNQSVKILTLQEVLKSYATFETSENGRVALMQETLPKPTLFPAIRSVSASNSRSVRYFV